MTFEQVVNSIRSRFNTEIATKYDLLTQYDNQNEPEHKDLWCRLTINFGDTFQKTLGNSNRRYRTVGIMTARLSIPVGHGDKKQITMGDKIIKAFRGITVGGVTYKTPNVKRAGRTGKYSHINVHCPFSADDIG